MAQVTNTEARLYSVHLGAGIAAGVLRLAPGVNTVPDADWAQAKKNPLVKGRIERGQLVEGAAAMPAFVPSAPPLEAQPGKIPASGGESAGEQQPQADAGGEQSEGDKTAGGQKSESTGDQADAGGGKDKDKGKGGAAK